MGLGADGGYRSSPYPRKTNRWLARIIILTSFQSFISVSLPETCGGTLGAFFFAALTTEARSLAESSPSTTTSF